MPDPKYMEVAAAFIELRPGHAATEEEIIEYCRGGSGRASRFRATCASSSEWPMSATKIQKFRLQEQLSIELAQAREASPA